jgi:hypothetical protein
VQDQGKPKVTGWTQNLPRDPVPALLSAENQALRSFVRRDLLGEDAGPVQDLWTLPSAVKILRKQQENGSWRYPGQSRARYPETNYDLLETFRQLGLLVYKYGFDQRHAAVRRAADYILSCQSAEGDIRGILGSQYMPYYHGVISELLVQAGYEEDSRLDRGLAWLLSMRQDDGGWIVPVQALPARDKTRALWSAPAIPPDRSLPSSHLATGMVLRFFAVHPRGRQLPEVQVAAQLLKSRLFRSDAYGDRKAPFYWTKFQYPFWWTNLLTALDSLSRLGFSSEDPSIQQGLQWFVGHQQGNGLWKTAYEQKERLQMSAKEQEAMLWVGLATCRVFRRFHDTS